MTTELYEKDVALKSLFYQVLRIIKYSSLSRLYDSVRVISLTLLRCSSAELFFSCIIFYMKKKG